MKANETLALADAYAAITCSIDEATKARAALAERIEALEKDAARYRFISVGFTPMGLDMSGNHPWVCRVSPSRLRGPTLDAAIDSAMKETP